jgi:hypothetical protein
LSCAPNYTWPRGRGRPAWHKPDRAQTFLDGPWHDTVNLAGCAMHAHGPMSQPKHDQYNGSCRAFSLTGASRIGHTITTKSHSHSPELEPEQRGVSHTSCRYRHSHERWMQRGNEAGAFKHTLPNNRPEASYPVVWEAIGDQVGWEC